MISLYGSIIALAVLSSILYAEKIVKAEKKSVNILWNLSAYAVIGGLVGARIYHVIDYWEVYSTYLIQVLYLWNGGLGIIGAIIGGIVTCILYLKVKRISHMYWLDLAVAVLPLGQSVGRWGNFFNQEVFGYPTSLPWGIYIPYSKRPIAYTVYEYFHPLFFYESLLCFLLFILLIKIRRHVKEGTLIYFYFAGYSLIRFLLDFIRLEQWKVGIFGVSQIISVILFIFSMRMLLKTYSKDKV